MVKSLQVKTRYEDGYHKVISIDYKEQKIYYKKFDKETYLFYKKSVYFSGVIDLRFNPEEISLFD